MIAARAVLGNGAVAQVGVGAPAVIALFHKQAASSLDKRSEIERQPLRPATLAMCSTSKDDAELTPDFADAHPGYSLLKRAISFQWELP